MARDGGSRRPSPVTSRGGNGRASLNKTRSESPNVARSRSTSPARGDGNKGKTMASVSPGRRSKDRDSASTATPDDEESPRRSNEKKEQRKSCSDDSSRSPREWPSPRAKSPKFEHRRTKGEVMRCKKGKRSDIKNTEWGKWNYAKHDEVLTRPIVYDEQTVPIRRVKRKDITPEWFYENITSKAEPVIVEDCFPEWPAMHRWSIEALEERFRQVAFKVAKDDKGKKLRMKFKYYADYIRNQTDDSPLYLFETNMDDNAYIRPLMDDYEVPDLFPDDWFALVNGDSRPPFRWFCIGPKRSGTTVHIDPLGTAAWNAVTHGCKHWVLFEPQESRKIVKGKDVIKKGEDDEAIMYFDFILPRIKKAHPELKVYEGLQKAGDLIFVPGDWWHGVLNREDCVAVTQNYCGPDNFDLVWSKTRKEREKVAGLWLRNMKRYAPKLYDRALEINKKDKFRMRHERAPGEKLSDLSSSSSESSSDSSSDEAADLDASGLKRAVGDDIALGADAFKLQGSLGADMARARGAEVGSVRRQSRPHKDMTSDCDLGSEADTEKDARGEPGQKRRRSTRAEDRS